MGNDLIGLSYEPLFKFNNLDAYRGQRKPI